MTPSIRLVLFTLVVVSGCSIATDFDRFKAGDKERGFDAGDGDGDGDAGPGAGDGDAPGDAGPGFDSGPAVEGQIDVVLAEGSLGTVTSLPTGINCGTDCSEIYEADLEVVLTAHPDPTAAFVGWGGACAGQTGFTCTLTTGEPLSVTAAFTSDWFDVTVSRLGGGQGSVRSADNMMSCSGAADDVCSVRYPRGSMIDLSATASAGASFSGWAGACQGAANPCELTVDGNKVLNAVFDVPGQVSLLVSKTGTGEGTITSGDGTSGTAASVDCGVDCAGSYPAAESRQILLSAVPDGSSEFVGFSGDCAVQSDTTKCLATLDAVKRVSAEFKLKVRRLDLAWNGQGAGSVVALDPVGLDCPKNDPCGRQYDHGTMIRLEARPAMGSTFRQWSEESCGTQPICEFPLLADKLLVAAFDVSSFGFTPATVGEGQLFCTVGGQTAPCLPASYPYGTALTVTAVPTEGHQLASWGQACTGTTGNVCQLTIGGPTTALANFAQRNHTITVTFEGNGSGSIAGDLVCNGTGSCSTSVAYGENFVITASAGALSLFSGFSGACGGGTCNIASVESDLSIVANFQPTSSPNRTLALTKVGKGTVTSTPAGISCGTGCAGANAEFTAGQVVTLSTGLVEGYAFSGFSGACTGNACTFAMDQPVKNVTATFTPLNMAVPVTVNGPGHVSSAPAGINCGGGGTVCSVQRPYDSTLVLTADTQNNPHLLFVGWGGACQGVPGTVCEVTVDTANAVTANFIRRSYDLVVKLTGDGLGGLDPLVTGNGLACRFNDDTNCRVTVPAETVIQLTGRSPAWAKFMGFGSPCSGGTTCSFAIIEKEVIVEANFKASGALVFVTHDPTNGTLNDPGQRYGAQRADEICASVASAQKLPGPWIAWLSDANSSPSDRLRSLRPSTRLIRVDGEVVALNGYEQAIDGALDKPIVISERGQNIAFQIGELFLPVWTGTSPKGTKIDEDDPSPFCTNWSTTTGLVRYGVGNAVAVSEGHWTYDSKGYGLKCVNSARLYCMRDMEWSER